MKRFLQSALSIVLTLSLFVSMVPVSLAVSEDAPAGDYWINYRAEEFSDYTRTTLTIHTAEELALYAYKCNYAGGSNFQTVTLANDISLYGHLWEPIQAASWTKFEGNGHTISGLTISETIETDNNTENSYYGMFQRVESVSNLELRNVKINLSLSSAPDTYSNCLIYCSALAYDADSITNCSASVNIDIEEDESSLADLYVAGLATNPTEIENCRVYGTIDLPNGGDVAGVAYHAYTITGCSNYADITLSGGGAAAGVCLFGDTVQRCVNYGDLTLGSGEISVASVCHNLYEEGSYCRNEGTITGTSPDDFIYAGGVFKRAEGSVTNCSNSGSIDLASTEAYAGGIVYETKEYGSVSDCAFSGSITSGRSAGGIACFNNFSIYSCRMNGKLTSPYIGGIVYKNYGSIESCENYGTLTSPGSGSDDFSAYSGGIAASNTGTISSCRNMKPVSGDISGGIAGWNRGTITGCVNSGAIEGAPAGGIAGIVDSSTDHSSSTSSELEINCLVEFCENAGSVTATDNCSGGIVGRVQGSENPISIHSNRNNGSITAIHAKDGWSTNAGGIAGGMIAFDGDAEIELLQCENSGTIRGHGDIGGVIGHINVYSENNCAALTIRDILNSGSVIGEYTCDDNSLLVNAGGLIGSAGGLFTLQNGLHIGTLTSPDRAGAVIGRRYNTNYMPGLYYLQANDLTCFGYDKLINFGGQQQVEVPYTLLGDQNHGNETVGFWLSYPWVREVLYADCQIESLEDRNGISSWFANASSETLCSFALRAMKEHAVLECDDPAIDISKYHPSTTATALSQPQMSDSANFPEFDFTNIWDMAGHPVLRMIGLDGAPAASAGYYYSITDKFFRFAPTDAGYPFPSNFTISLAGTPYSTGGSSDVSIPIPSDFSGTILCSKPGYHSYELPKALVGSYNVITMTPSNVETPFVEALLADMSSGVYKIYRNLRSEGLTVYEADLSADLTTEHIYTSVNWNGHGAGSVWLEQGSTTLNLIDGGFKSLQLGMYFDFGRTVYVCGKAEDGTTFRHATKIQMAKPSNYSSFDFGSSLDTTIDPEETDDTMSFLDNMSLSMDFSNLYGGLIPVKVKTGADGTIKGTIGLSLYKENLSLKGKQGESMDLEKDNLFSMVKEFVDLYKQGYGPDGETLDQVLVGKKLKELNALGEMTSVPSEFGVKGKVQLLGYFYGDSSTGKIQISQCSMVLLFNGSAVCTVPYTAWGVPGYIETELATKIEAILSDWKYNAETDTMEKEGDAALNGALSLAVTYALGYNDVLSIGAKGEGSVNLETVIPIKLNKTNMYLQGALSLVGNTLGFAGEWTIFESDKQYFYYKGELCWKKGSELVRMSDLSPDESFTPAVLALASAPAPLNENTIQSNVYPAAQTAFAVLNDYTYILVWQGLREDDSANGAALYCSVGDGYNWSDPQLLDTDGTSDFNPVLKNVNGSLYLMWNDLSKTYDTLPESFGDVIADTQISVMRFDETEREFLDLGSVDTESSFDMAPDLYESDGQLLLSWQSYESGAEKPVQVLAELTDDGWTTEAVGNVFWYDPNPISEGALVFGQTASHVKNEFGEGVIFASQNNIWGVFNDGSGWGSPVQLATLPTNTEAYSVSAAYDSYGTLLVCVSCGSLTSNDGVLSGQNDLLFYEVNLEPDISVLAADYIAETLIPGEERELTGWVEVQNNSAQTIHSICVDITGDYDYSDSRYIITDIASGTGETVYFNFTLPENVADVSDSYTFFVYSDGITEDDTSNNTISCEVRKVDLSVEGIHAIGYESTGEASVWIVNRGLNDVTNAVVSLVSVSDEETALTESQTISLSAGSGAAVNFTDVDFSGETQVMAVVSCEEAENITANNKSIGTIQFITPGKISANLLDVSSDGSLITVPFLVENTSSTEETVTLAVACYAEGRMLAMHLLPSVSVAGNDIRTDTVTFDAASDKPVSVKLFMLSADGTFVPLQEIVSTQSIYL